MQHGREFGDCNILLRSAQGSIIPRYNIQVCMCRYDVMNPDE